MRFDLWEPRFPGNSGNHRWKCVASKDMVGGEHDPGSAWYSDQSRQYVVCWSGLVEKGRGCLNPGPCGLMTQRYTF